MITDLRDFPTTLSRVASRACPTFFRQYKSYMILNIEKAPRILVKS